MKPMNGIRENNMKLLIVVPVYVLFLLTANTSAQGNPDVIWSVNGHSLSVEAVACSPDGQMVASGAAYSESLVKVWRTANGSLIHTFAGHDGGVQSMQFSPDGRFLAVGYIVNGYPPGGETKLWDLQEQSVHAVFGGCFATFSPDGEFVASGGGGVNRYLKVHRISGSELITQFYNGSYITSVAYSSDGQLIAVGGTDNTVKLIDASSGNLVRTLTGHTDDVQTIAFSPDGQVIASGAGGWDNPGESSIKLWQVSDGSLIDTFAGHGDWVQKLAFSPDGGVLVSSGRDGVYPNVSSRIKFWDVSDGAILKYYDELALDLSFTLDGRQFFYGQAAGKLTLADNPVDEFETGLFYDGDAQTGNGVDIRLLGPSGASPVALWIGSGILDTPLSSKWGNWYLEFPVYGPIVFAPIPAGNELTFSVMIPAAPSGPYEVPVQAFIGNEFTNPSVISVLE